MGSGIKGTNAGGGSQQVSGPPVDKSEQKPAADKPADQPKPDSTASPKATGRTAAGLATDPAAAMHKATLAKSVDTLKTPTKTQLNEIQKAITDGKKEEAIRLTIKYYNIDTSGAAEVKYAPPKKQDSAEATGKKAEHFEHIDTATKKVDGKVVIEIGDESFQFKGKPSPQWLASAIYHESFHAKNHFNPNEKPIMKPDTAPPDPEHPKMSQEEVFQEIEAYAKERGAATKLGLSDEQVQEIQKRQDRLKGMLTRENLDLVIPMLRKTEPWPHQ